MSALSLELIYEGDHCAPCVYLREVAEAALAGLEAQVWVVNLRQPAGGRRYRELSAALGRPAPIPSLFVDGRLAYDHTPPVEELRALLRDRLAATGEGQDSSRML